MADGAVDGAGDAEGGAAEPEAAGDPEAAAGEPLAPGLPLAALPLGASVGTGVGDGAACFRSIGSVLMSMNPSSCRTTIAWRPFALKTAATWSAVTFASANLSCHVVPPV